jgi:hypothetical protein
MGIFFFKMEDETPSISVEKMHTHSFLNLFNKKRIKSIHQAKAIDLGMLRRQAWRDLVTFDEVLTLQCIQIVDLGFRGSRGQVELEGGQTNKGT